MRRWRFDRRRLGCGGPLRRLPGCAAAGLALACLAPGLEPIGSSRGRFAPTQQERALWEEGARAEQALEASGALLRDPALERYLEGLSARLLAGRLAGTGTSIRVRVLRDPTPNAHALAHGTLILHSGLVARVQSEAQLAAVIAHELVHVTHRHGARHARAMHRARDPIEPLAALGPAADAASGRRARLASLTRLSRELEAEADREGLRLLLAAGHSGDEVIALFEQLGREREARTRAPRLAPASHPELDARIARHRSWVEALGPPAPPSATGALDHVVIVDAASRRLTRGERRLLRGIAPALLADAMLNLERGETALARSQLERLLAVRPGSAGAWYGLGEVARLEGGATALAERRRAYARATQRDPGFAEAHRALALLELERGEAGAARPHLARYAALAPAADDVAILRGLVAEGGPRYARPRAARPADPAERLATIALAPLFVPRFVENAAPLRRGFESLITARLEGCGYDVVPVREVQAVWDWMLARLGDYGDAERGGFDEARLDVARGLARWELARSFGAEAMLDPRIELVDAVYDGRVASWMGASVELRPAPRRTRGGLAGRLAPARGDEREPLKASGLRITIDDREGRVWHQGAGAIEVVERVEGVALRRPLFHDAARNRAAVQRALAALRDPAGAPCPDGGSTR